MPFNDHTKPADRLRPTRGKRTYQTHAWIMMGLTVGAFVILQIYA